MTVLVATPARHDTPAAFLDMSECLYESLTFTDRERVLMLNDVAHTPSRKYGRNAIARNGLIKKHLKSHHTHVLWLDVDLVDVPADTIERLMAITETDAVAPHVYMERIKDGPPSFWNGGWFYDTGGFVKDGRTRDMWQPDLPGLQEMDSVGCCYLIPAGVYRAGCRYEPEGDEVEHISFFRQARAMGVRAWATDSVIVTHAYLPKYGEAWHS